MGRLRINLSFKFIVTFLFIIAALAIGANFNQVQSFLQTEFNQYFIRTACDTPVDYKIGYVDPRFGLSTTGFLVDVKQAAWIWDKADQGKELFKYDPSNKGALAINLVFDKRAALNNQINNLEGQVKQKNQSLQSNISSYEQQVADFKSRLADFNNQVDALNAQINDWNQRGGAPPDEYQKLAQQQNNLTKEQTNLQAQADSLNQIARNLNLSTEDYNTEVGKLNNTISIFGQALAQKPEEGLFNPNSNLINIYFVNNHNELIHTLAHELGHALGLQHNQNKLSIMYPYSTQSIIPSIDDVNSLKEICSMRYLNLPFLKAFRFSLGWPPYSF